jgi:hypothetical protein
MVIYLGSTWTNTHCLVMLRAWSCHMASFCGFLNYQILEDSKESVVIVLVSVVTSLLLKVHTNELGSILPPLMLRVVEATFTNIWFVCCTQLESFNFARTITTFDFDFFFLSKMEIFSFSRLHTTFEWILVTILM